MVAATSVPPTVEPASARGDARSRLDGVDGLRAAAALWVVLFHVRAFSGAHVGPLDLVIRSGSTGVSLFLVLSGFCLYLPVARAGAHSFSPRKFFVRRARRLLPAYYASLALVLVAIIVTAGRVGLPVLHAPDLVAQTAAHVTMTHSLFPSTFYALNGAYWSLALEWQLYLALPLLVVCVRRFGLTRTLLAVVAVNVVYRLGLEAAIALHVVAGDSLTATAVLPNLLPGRWAEFAFGMLAADLYATGRVAAWSERLRFAVVPILALSLLVVGNPLSHVLFGAVFFSLLCVVLAADTPLARLFAWRPLAALGVMSYSIYLVHQPIVQALATVLGDRGASPSRIFAEEIVLLPVVIAIAWLLFVLVERRTIHPAGRVAVTRPEALVLAPLTAARRVAGRWRARAASPEPAPQVALLEAGEP